jgi:hypothetical protein
LCESLALTAFFHNLLCDAWKGVLETHRMSRERPPSLAGYLETQDVVPDCFAPPRSGLKTRLLKAVELQRGMSDRNLFQLDAKRAIWLGFGGNALRAATARLAGGVPLTQHRCLHLG